LLMKITVSATEGFSPGISIIIEAVLTLCSSLTTSLYSEYA
jgi:hypothetical protein